MDDKCGFVIRFLQFLPLSHPPQIETMLVLFKKKASSIPSSAWMTATRARCENSPTLAIQNMV